MTLADPTSQSDLPHLEVAVASPLEQTLTYSCRPGQGVPAIGVRLLVPLGGQRLTGYVLAHLTAEKTEFTIKPYIQQLDQHPLFPANMVDFFRWLASYYQYPLGETIKQALPGGLTQRTSTLLTLTALGQEELPGQLAALDPSLAQGLACLAEQTALSASQSRQLLNGPQAKLVKKWLRQGLLNQQKRVLPPSTKEKLEWCVSRCHGPLPAKLKKTELKTLELLAELSQEKEAEHPRPELTRQYSGAGPAIRCLAEQGLVCLKQRQVYRDPFGLRPPHFNTPQQLTTEQEQALAQINPAIAEQRYATFLLHGVTGSGKTEVFLRAAENCLARQRGVVVLVPEIALATQLEGHFVSRFGDQVAVLHSGLSSGERFDQWRRIARGEAPVVIGARSAIFAPLPKPGLFIVDEEHDSAYKQEDSLRYNARDVAVLRAQQQQGVAILGSATPAISSFYNASQEKKYQLLSMSQRVGNRALPAVDIVDLKGVKTVSGRPPLFSPQLMQELRQNLAAGNQSLIFLNRRGYANLLICADCGETIKCPHCAITLTLHKGEDRLLCHYCDHQAASKPVCPQCRSHRIREVGFGTERLEDELATALPSARLARLDRDTSVKRSNFLETLNKVRRQEIDILIGTQMITKGHHFPHVTLVGLIWADAGLSMPDYKAAERTFQLISQVTGRAGRGDKPGKVIIQTHQPDHYAVALAQSHDYLALYEKEISLRQGLRYPPFARLINIRFSGKNEEETWQAAMQCGQQARAKQLKNIEVLGPAPAPLSRLRQRFRFQLLLKGWQLPQLKQLAQELRQQPSKAVKSKRVRMTLDVDPEAML